MKKSYSSVDLLKFLFCICIIALHSGVLLLLPQEVRFYITQLIVRLAVPYFFVASGFFLRKKYVSTDQAQYKSVLAAYIKRLLVPFLFFSCIWIWQYWTNYMLNGLAQTEILWRIAKDVVFYPQGALWFVQACIVAAILVFPFMRLKNGVNICLAIGTVLYVFALLCNTYFFVVENSRFESVFSGFLSFCGSARNGLFVGFIFISLGMKCYDIFEKLQKGSGQGTTVLFFAAIALVVYIFEVVILHLNGCSSRDDNSLYISQLVWIPLLFLSSVLFSVRIPTGISLVLRNLSTGMYFLHRPILWWVAFFSDNELINFVLVTIIAFAICMISYKIKFKNKYYLLR